MDKKLLTMALAGTIFTMAFLPGVSMAGKGRMGGQGVCTQTSSASQLQVRQRFHDGTCLNCGASGAAGTAQQKGKTYGPGDGTGNQGTGPKDGTGNGASANQ